MSVKNLVQFRISKNIGLNGCKTRYWILYAKNIIIIFKYNIIINLYEYK